MTVAELSSLLPAAEARLLDVRTPSEFEHAHVAGSYNVPLNQRVSLERTALIAGLPPRLLQQAFAVTLVILGSYVLLNT